MLTITKESENFAVLSVKGQIDAVEMRVGLDELISVTKDMKDGKLLYLIDDFEIPTFSAIMVEMTKLPALFGMISRIDKCAVVADESWIRTVGEWEGKFIPGLDIKGFDEGEEDAARAWLEADDFSNMPV